MVSVGGRAGFFQTARLDLVAASVEHLRAELESFERLGEVLGAEVARGWPPGVYDQDAMRFFLDRLLSDGDEAVGWYGWYGVRRAAPGQSALLVAAAGYMGPPSEGAVEIGYSVVGAERGAGYATEVAEGLAARALAMPGIERVLAEVHALNTASLKVLGKCGFRQIGPGREKDHLRFERVGRMSAEPSGSASAGVRRA